VSLPLRPGMAVGMVAAEPDAAAAADVAAGAATAGVWVGATAPAAPLHDDKTMARIIRGTSNDKRRMEFAPPVNLLRMRV
jgi:hypothetical protein